MDLFLSFFTAEYPLFDLLFMCFVTADYPSFVYIMRYLFR